MGYVCGVTWFFASFIHFTSLTIYPTSAEVKRYYFFSLLTSKWVVEKGETKNVELVKRYEKASMPASETWLDLVLIFFSIKGNIQFIRIWIDKKYKNRSVSMQLTNEEYDLLDKVLNVQ